MELLNMQHVTMQFGGLKAVDDLSLAISQGQIFGLLGPNGSGKTTTFNLISGFYKPTAGEIFFRDKRIDGLPMHKINQQGIARTFQHISLFRELTVLENAMIGRHTQLKSGLAAALLRPPATLREEASLREEARRHLEFVGLLGKQEELAGNLAYGEQRMLEIARALASEPVLLILDEPAAGMNPSEKDVLQRLVREIRGRGVTVLVIEHDMRFIMGITDRIAVLDHGIKISEGTPEEVQNDEKVIEAYLGKRREDA